MIIALKGPNKGAGYVRGGGFGDLHGHDWGDGMGWGDMYGDGCGSGVGFDYGTVRSFGGTGRGFGYGYGDGDGIGYGGRAW